MRRTCTETEHDPPRAYVVLDKTRRCAICGHRVPVDGIPPRPTRTMPPWHWRAELRARKRARMMT